MAYSHNPDIFRWKRVTKTKKPTADKQVQLNNGEINQWMKTVEMASDIAVTEVFSLKKPHSVISSQSMALHSTEQLLDHDQAYGEAQALLSDWMNSKLRLELEMEEGEDVIVSPEKNSPEAMPPAQPVSLDYSNFDDLYSHLAEEEESSAVNNFLQDLMEREVVDSGIVEDLALDSEERDRRMRRDPSLTMEARHRQVRENRARRDAERERLHRERVARRQAREEAQRREQGEERRRRQEARRQEEMVQQEMVRLRRETEERRNLEQLARQMERERIARKTAAKSSLVLQPGPSFSTAQKQRDTERPLRLQQVEVRVQMHNLKCLQRHFSGWYSVLLERRLQMGKAAALCDWRSQLRAWRDWRALVWAGREQREAERTEEELRTQKRRCQVAMVSDRRRLLRRCLSDWRLWCRAERERRELLSQQQETRRKMAALINAVATGKLKMMEETHTPEPITALPEPSDQSETVELKGQPGSQPAGPTPSPACQGDGPLGAVVLHTLPWQVTRRNAALSAGELRRARERGEVGDGDDSVGAAPRSHTAAVCGGRFEHRHASQLQTIAEQRKLLREQQEQIARLQEEQSMMGLRQEAQTAAQIAVPASPRPREMTSDPKESRAGRVARGNDGRFSANRKPAVRQPCRHPTVMAMEERARQRAERRREVEELKRKKEEERLAQLKTAVKERQREEEDEKRRAVERRREEKRQEREREQEKQWRLERDQQLQTQAQQHYHRTLLLWRGLEPWKRLVAQSQANTQLARAHHRQSLLRRCTLSWQQVAGESLAQKWASADQLHQHILLRRSLGNWKRLKDHCMVLEGRAERFWRTHTLKRALIGLLDHVTQERMADWDREQQAQEHSTRRVVRSCFQAWRRYPGWLREERGRETRREQLRRRVAEVLPDFCSSPLDCTWEQGPL
ncbi:coiled-coil domain-containing protein 191 [Oncorhynchus nerka]|uniref:coiled-coil domain-containing protein 191 n=1 Tax=Oncorhynchus nerka TaxID=8023 RepID=UPI0031B8444F